MDTDRSTVAELVGSGKPPIHKLAASDASSFSTHFWLDIDEAAEARMAQLDPEQLSRLLDTMPSLIWCLTADGELSYYNKRLVDWFGLDLADMECPDKSFLAAAIENVVHPNDRATVHERITHSCSTGNPFDMKYRQRRADGAYRLTHCRAEPLRNSHGQIVQWHGVVTDIEDEVRTQNSLGCAQNGLARAAQLTSLAELSASIAQELNQPLAAIVASAHACERWLTADPPNVGRARIASERIARDANQAASLVELLASIAQEVIQPLAAIVASAHACQRWLATDPPNIGRARIASERITRDANSASDVVNRIHALFKRSISARAAANSNDVIMGVSRLMADQIRMGNTEVK